MLVFFQFLGIGVDVLIGGVAPRCMEVGLGLNFFILGDDGPSLDVGKDQVGGLFVLSDILLHFFFGIFCVDNLIDDGDPAEINGLLELVFLPEVILLLLEFEELTPLHLVGNCGIYGGRLGYWPAGKVYDAGCAVHLCIVK